MTNVIAFNPNQNLTMSSLEIAKLVNSNHPDVRRSIERLAERGVISLSPLAEVKVQRERREEKVSVYNLDKRSSLIVVAQLCPEFTAAVVDRWQELEAGAADPIKALSDPIKLRGILLAYTEKVVELENQVGELEPKARALDLISACTEAVTITQAAKMLSIKRGDLIAYMHAHGWIYRQNTSWVAYQQHIQNGRLLYKEASFTDEKTGVPRASSYCHILPKGLAKLAEHFSDRKAA